MLKNKSSKITILKWLVNLAIPFFIACIPTSTGGFTPELRSFLVVTVFAIILIATGNIPLFTVSILLPVAYVVLLGIDTTVAFRAWSMEIPWLILGGFILTIALQKTGLLKRLAYGCILLFGGKFRGILYGLMLLGAILSIVIADMAAKAILLGALTLGICNAMDLKLGDRAASALGLTAIAATLSPSYLFLTGSSGNLVTFGVATTVGLTMPTFFEYLVHMFLPQVIYCILVVLSIDLLFRPKLELQTKNYFKKELSSLGKLNSGEVKIAIITLFLVVGIATTSIHGIAIGWLFVVAASLLMVPGINLVSGEDIKQVNFTYVFFVVACLGIGIVSADVGMGAFVSTYLYPYIAGSLTRMLGGVWLLGFGVNFALTPLAAYSAFTGPIVEMTTAAGYNPLPIIYTFMHGLEQVVFPYEYAPALIIFGYGMCSFGDFVKFNLLRAAISIACIFLIFVPYWSLIGLL